MISVAGHVSSGEVKPLGKGLDDGIREEDYRFVELLIDVVVGCQFPDEEVLDLLLAEDFFEGRSEVRLRNVELPKIIESLREPVFSEPQVVVEVVVDVDDQLGSLLLVLHHKLLADLARVQMAFEE